MAVDTVNQRNEHIREAKEDKEQSLVAKHRREIAELQRKHVETIQGLKEGFDEQLTELRKDSREALTSKEQNHLKEIQEVQDVNRKRLMKTKADDEEQLRTTKSTLLGELERSKGKNESDNTRLTKLMESELSKKDSATRDMELKSREGSQEAIKNQANRYQDKFEEERNFYRSVIGENIKEKEREFGDLRRSKEVNEKNLKGRLESQKQRADERFKDTVLGDRARYQASLDQMSEGYQQQRGIDHEKLDKQSTKLNTTYVDNLDNLRETVDSRIEKEVRSVRRENHDLKNALTTDKVEMNRKKETEKKNLTNEFQKSIVELEKRRGEATTQAHEGYAKKIDEVQGRNDKFIESINTSYGRKLEEQKINHQKHFDEEIGYVTRDRDVNKMQTDKQKKKLVDIYADKTVMQTDFYEDQIDLKKKDAEQALVNQRNNMQKQHLNDVGTLRNQLVKESVDHQEKLIDTTSKYEKQLNTMRNEFEKKFRQQNELFREQTNSQVKNQQMERESFEAKMKQRINQVKEVYEREIEQLRKRQAVERQDLATKKT